MGSALSLEWESMAVQGKPVHLEADYRNLARTLSSISFPKDGGSKQGCYPGAMTRQPPRSKAPNLAAPRGACTYEGPLTPTRSRPGTCHFRFMGWACLSAWTLSNLACLLQGPLYSGYSLDITRNYGAGKFCLVKSNVKEILRERKYMDFWEEDLRFNQI